MPPKNCTVARDTEQPHWSNANVYPTLSTTKHKSWCVQLPVEVPYLLVVFKADVTDPQLAAELKKKRTFRTFSYRGVELEQLLDMNTEDVRLPSYSEFFSLSLLLYSLPMYASNLKL